MKFPLISRRLPYSESTVWEAIRILGLTWNSDSCCYSLASCGQSRMLIPCPSAALGQPHSFIVQGGPFSTNFSARGVPFLWTLRISVDEVGISSTEMGVSLSRVSLPWFIYPIRLIDKPIVFSATNALLRNIEKEAASVQFYRDHRNRWPKP